MGRKANHQQGRDDWQKAGRFDAKKVGRRGYLDGVESAAQRQHTQRIRDLHDESMRRGK